MNNSFKTLFFVLMTMALAFGFMHHVVPTTTVNFERLHIFLFNLCSGGTIILYFTEGKDSLSNQGKLFLALSLCFALTSFFQLYILTSILPILLAVIVERIRIKQFGSVFPYKIFSRKEHISRKFHQASLLCLSIGLTISAPVVLNEVYFHFVHIPKLKLDTFFLGFSFPVSLISMSVIFSLMKDQFPQPRVLLKNLSFWVINLGVIIFFLFILANWFIPQVVIASILFIAVSVVLYIYLKEGIRLQQKAFLASGIFFLIATSITGIIYILLEFAPGYDPIKTQPLLRIHAFTALYGWNLSGLAVVCRHKDFPIQLHSPSVILLHWVTVLILCPMGYFFPAFAVLAVIAYGCFLYFVLFKSCRIDEQIVKFEKDMLITADSN